MASIQPFLPLCPAPARSQETVGEVTIYPLFCPDLQGRLVLPRKSEGGFSAPLFSLPGFLCVPLWPLLLFLIGTYCAVHTWMVTFFSHFQFHSSFSWLFNTDSPGPGGKDVNYRPVLPGGLVHCIPLLPWPNLSLFPTNSNLPLPCFQVFRMVLCHLLTTGLSD